MKQWAYREEEEWERREEQMNFAFGEYELDTTLHELRRDGAVCAIEPQVFDLLHYLIRHRERLVTKDELLDAVWTDRTVSDWALSSRIMSARKAVGDDGKTQALIRTIPRRGFRFVASAEVVQCPQKQMKSDADEPFASQRNLRLPDKPSITVLPFDNMSGDPDQEYFADGIAEDVITALSRFSSLFVIARNSSFSYKGTLPDIRTVAGELGVRYVIEGSVRKAGNRVRITAQLIDAASGNHLWADRFDGNLDDVFDLQDQITEQIVVAIEPEIGARERERARRKPPESLDAWELVQRGLSHFHRVNETDRAEAIRLFRAAVALDPEFAAAHAHLANALWSSVTVGHAKDTAKAVASARAAAEHAVSLDPNEPMAQFILGRARVFTREIELAIGNMQTAIAINPNFARGHFGLGWVYRYGAGRPEQSLPHFDDALRLSPRDPMPWSILMAKGAALRTLGRYDEAIVICRQACQFPDSGFRPHMHLATSLAEAGQMGEARMEVEKTMIIQPAFSIGFLRNRNIGIHPSSWKSLVESLRKAGFPE